MTGNWIIEQCTEVALQDSWVAEQQQRQEVLTARVPRQYWRRPLVDLSLYRRAAWPIYLTEGPRWGAGQRVGWHRLRKCCRCNRDLWSLQAWEEETVFAIKCGIPIKPLKRATPSWTLFCINERSPTFVIITCQNKCWANNSFASFSYYITFISLKWTLFFSYISKIEGIEQRIFRAIKIYLMKCK